MLLSRPLELEWFRKYAKINAGAKNDGGTDGRFHGCHQTQR